nr:hypothetical protein [bacterium]NIN91666.1 hypothetical protein [bacterium]NIO72981.1 hypothetical protein [bacterium]
GRMLEEVNPVGGREKVNAIKDSLKRSNSSPQDAIYVGDSITDREALSFIKENGGLAVSFNGNRYAIEKAEVVCISENTAPISTLANAFSQGGKGKVMELVRNWKEKLPLLELVSENNIERLVSVSERFRKSVRGEAGSLG